MNTTTNFGLNQWEATDRVMREDFNRDNVKIDQAIRTSESRVKLMDITTTAAVNQIDFDMQNIHLEDYLEVILCTDISVSARFRCNELSIEGSYIGQSLTSGNTNTLYMCEIAFPYRCTGTPSASLLKIKFSAKNDKIFGYVYDMTTDNTTMSLSNSIFMISTAVLTASALTTINVIAQSLIPANTNFAIYGVRK